MKTKLFSMELVTDTMNNGKEAKYQDARIEAFEDKINAFTSANPEYVNTEWMQSSAYSNGASFTRMTAVLSTN